MHSIVILLITERIKEKSRPTRSTYLERVSLMKKRDKGTDRLGCANVAHAIAALPKNDKFKIVSEKKARIQKGFFRIQQFRRKS